MAGTEEGTGSSIVCVTTPSGVDACATNAPDGTVTLEGPASALFLVDKDATQTLLELCKDAVEATSSITMDANGHTSEAYLSCTFPNGVPSRGNGAGRE